MIIICKRQISYIFFPDLSIEKAKKIFLNDQTNNNEPPEVTPRMNLFHHGGHGTFSAKTKSYLSKPKWSLTQQTNGADEVSTAVLLRAEVE